MIIAHSSDCRWMERHRHECSCGADGAVAIPRTELDRLRAEVAECKELLRVIMEVPPLNATPKWVARRCNAYDRARAILAPDPPKETE